MLDMSYLPRNTPLLQLAWARKDGNWVTQTGIDVLIKQVRMRVLLTETKHWLFDVLILSMFFFSI